MHAHILCQRFRFVSRQPVGVDTPLYAYSTADIFGRLGAQAVHVEAQNQDYTITNARIHSIKPYRNGSVEHMCAVMQLIGGSSRQWIDDQVEHLVGRNIVKRGEVSLITKNVGNRHAFRFVIWNTNSSVRAVTVNVLKSFSGDLSCDGDFIHYDVNGDKQSIAVVLTDEGDYVCGVYNTSMNAFVQMVLISARRIDEKVIVNIMILMNSDKLNLNIGRVNFSRDVST